MQIFTFIIQINVWLIFAQCWRCSSCDMFVGFSISIAKKVTEDQDYQSHHQYDAKTPSLHIKCDVVLLYQMFFSQIISHCIRVTLSKTNLNNWRQNHKNKFNISLQFRLSHTHTKGIYTARFTYATKMWSSKTRRHNLFGVTNKKKKSFAHFEKKNTVELIFFLLNHQTS